MVPESDFAIEMLYFLFLWSVSNVTACIKCGVETYCIDMFGVDRMMESVLRLRWALRIMRRAEGTKRYRIEGGTLTTVVVEKQLIVSFEVSVEV